MRKRKFFRAVARVLTITGVLLGLVGKGLVHLAKWTTWCGMMLAGIAVKIFEDNQEPAK